MQTFKKGQIVPRRLRKALASNSKGQHHITFGADVAYENGAFKALSEGPCIRVEPVTRKRNNGTRQKLGFMVMNASVIPFGWDLPSLTVGSIKGDF